VSKPTSCLICGTALEQPATGRPRVYCDAGCRRTGENEVKRLARTLESLEGSLRFDRLYEQGTKRERLRRQTRIQGEIDRATARMVALLGGLPEDVSPAR
jgi:hypothetical protein